jgi:hypothetical protein
MTEGERPVWPRGMSQRKFGFGDLIGQERFGRGPLRRAGSPTTLPRFGLQ